MHYDAETGELAIIAQSTDADPRSDLRAGESFEGIPFKLDALAETDLGPRGFGTMTQIAQSNLQTYPWRANTKLVMRFVDEGGTTRFFVCSGTMQDAGIVFTAAHCLYIHDANIGGTNVPINDWAREVWVYPAWDGEGAQFSAPANAEHREHWGWARSTSYMAFTGWTNNEDFNWDVAAVRLRRTQTRQVGMLTGWFGWSSDDDCTWLTTEIFYNSSYPTENCPTVGLHTGREMYFWSGTFDSCHDTNRAQIDTTPGCMTAVWGGMSGSSAYFDTSNRRTHAIVSTSNRSTRGRYARIWGNFSTEILDNVRPGVRGDVADYELLRFRSDPPLRVVDGQSVGPSRVNVTNATNDNPASRSFTLRVYLSNNNIISEADTLLATWTYSNVNFSEMEIRQFNIPAPTIPAGTPPGTYWLGAVLDSSSDSNPSNNNVWGWDAQEIEVVSDPVFSDGFTQ